MASIDYDVYLSFTREDNALGRAVGRYLRASGLRVAMPNSPEETGETPWVAAVERSISRARKMVVLISESSPSGWLRAELDFASRQLHLEVVPLIREGFSRSEDFPALSLFTPMRLPNDRHQLDGRLERLVRRVRREGAPLRPPIDRAARPFPGLRPYGVNDGRWFFGRARQLAEATDSVGFGEAHSRWLRVEGAAGIGKTSFARAGVVDTVLRGGAHGGPSDWYVAAFRPGRHPFQALSDALGEAFAELFEAGTIEVALAQEGGLGKLLTERLPKELGLLLIIDHLDDVAAAWEQGAPGVEAFDTQVANAVQGADTRTILVTTSLSGQARRTLDVLSHLNEQADTATVVALGGLPRGALRQVIERPLEMIGRRWPQPLIDRLLEDATHVSGGPGALNWMLNRLLTDKTPTEAWYEALGGLRHGPGRGLDSRLAAVGDGARDRALVTLLSLIGAGRGRDDQLLGMPLSEVVAIAGGGADGDALVRAMTSGAGPSAPDPLLRLDPGGSHVRLAHSELLRVWPRMRGLLATNRAVLERRADVERAAAVWSAGGRNPAQLPEGAWLERDIGGDLPPGDRQRLKSILASVGRAYVDAAEAAEEARLVAKAGAEEQEREALESSRVQERSADRSRVRGSRRWAVGFGLAAAALLALLVVQGIAARRTADKLRAATAEKEQLASATSKKEQKVDRLQERRDSLDKDKSALTTSLRRAQAVAKQAAEEAEELLAHAVDAAKLADGHLGLWNTNSGMYNRRGYFVKLVDRLERQVTASPENDRLRLLLARLQVFLGDVTSLTGPFRAGPGHFADAVKTLQPLVSRQRPAPAFLQALAEAHERAGEFLAKPRTVGTKYIDYPAGAEQMAKAVEIWERAQKLYPQHPANRVGLGRTLARLGQINERASDLAAARRAMKRALIEAKALAHEAPKDFERAFDVARRYGQLASIETKARDFAPARKAYDDALAAIEVAEKLASEDQQADVGKYRQRYTVRRRVLPKP